MSVASSNEMFINMKSVPRWDPKKNYFDQDIDTLDFFLEEKRKITEGINIGGYFVHPWLYFHLNFFKTPLPSKIKGEPDIIMNPPLDDNIYFTVESYKEASDCNKGLCIFGSRGFSKSTTLASLTQWLNTIKVNGRTSIVGQDAADLGAITTMFRTGILNVHSAFYIPQLIQDWDKNVEFGVKEKNGFKYNHSYVSITNAEGGKGKASEKGAGLTPVGFIIDEIGKFDPRPILKSALPSFKGQNGSRLTHLLSGTGGNVELSVGAKQILSNPKDWDLIMMNWDRLDNMVPEEAITWKESKGTSFSMFVPGQMSYRLAVPKVEKSLAEFLKTDNKDLDRIKINCTDWVNATKLIEDNINSKSDENARNSERMYYPTKIEHCFLTEQANPFPMAVCERKKINISLDPKYRTADLTRTDKGTTVQNFSSKIQAEREFKGKFIDAPFLIYGDFPEKQPELYTYVSGLDDYKQDQSTTTSLGSFYVLKRRGLEINNPTETIALSYASRPQEHKTLWKNCALGVTTYNAHCCMESADVGFVSYLDNIGNPADYLTAAFRPGNDLISRNKQQTLNSRFGIYPTPANKQYIIDLVIAYANEEHVIGISEDGNPMVKVGAEFIEDPWLLQEMIDYTPTANVDRIVAFGHALAYSRKLDKERILPEDELTKKRKEEMARKISNKKFNNFGNGNFVNF